jgi:hypothetical protein
MDNELMMMVLFHMENNTKMLVDNMNLNNKQYYLIIEMMMMNMEY